MNEMDNKWIGKNTIRPDGADKVTGRAEYAADTIMPGMIWGKVLRSPYPHATIKSINTKKAEELDGVFSVATSADCVDFPVDTPVILGIQDIRWMARNVLAKEKVLFHGHPIAAVAARTEEIAEKACELIEVDYDVHPWAIEIDDAIKPDAPILHDFIKFDGKPSNIAGTLEHKKGNIEEGFYFKDVKKINFIGPFLIDNKLILFSSNGYLKIIDPLNGKLLKSINFDILGTEPIFIEDKLIILTSDGDLKVYK